MIGNSFDSGFPESSVILIVSSFIVVTAIESFRYPAIWLAIALRI
jgi:hypothetical protein